MRKLFSLIWVVTTLAISTSLSAADKVEYRLDISNPDQQYADVTVLFPESAESYIDVTMGTWRTGRYEILELANGVRHLKASDTTGTNLPAKKINKHTWRIYLSEPTKVVVTYQLYANQLELRTRHIDDTHAYLDGVATFMYSEAFIDNPLEIDLKVPQGWRSRSGMTATGRHAFKADNYHILASSPIETGFHDYYEFEVSGKTYELVIWGKGNFDPQRILSDYKKMIPIFGDVWGNYPFDRYLFIIHSADGLRGATEHINSTIIQRDSMSFNDKEEYHSFLSTSSHEFVHTWNVKQYRPEGMQRYDYSQENYSYLLWITEGSTSYLADLLLMQSDVIPLKDYLTKLAKNINNYLNRPGTSVQSATEGSFDTWINPRGHQGTNDSVSIYNEGLILSLFMDIKLISDTQGEGNYRQLHRLLYERYPVPEKGFSASDVQALLTELGSKDANEIWQKHMESANPVNISELLAQVGLEFLPYGKTAKQPLYMVDTGITFTQDSNKISQVLRGTDAWQAGLTLNDEIVAVNGIKLNPGKWQDILSTYADNDEVRVSYFRRNILRETPLVISRTLKSKPTIVPVKNPTEAQKALFKAWTGKDLPLKKTETNSESQ